MSEKHGFELQFLTDKQYVDSGGSQCPNCHQDTLEGDSWSAEGDCATQEVSCLTCGATWIDVYNLVGYSDLELDTNQDES